MMKAGVLPTEDKGDKSNSVEVISGDAFDTSSNLYVNLLCYEYKICVPSISSHFL